VVWGLSFSEEGLFIPHTQTESFMKSIRRSQSSAAGQLKVVPLTSRNWEKFAELFGEKGACGNCWCMLFRTSRTVFEMGKADDGNRKAMKKLVSQNVPTGMLGMLRGKAIAWCAFAPRADFPKLERSRVHKRIDDKPVWSIPCFFVAKDFRRQGVSVAMLKGMIAHARKKGIQTLEAYPTIPTQGVLPDAFAWIGLYESFRKAGFTIVDRTSKNRPMVRYEVT
jgi:GNAT superfamily N-acetyltransferase